MAGPVSTSTGIEQQHLDSREQLAEQVALVRLERAAAAAKAWRQLGAVERESLEERYERLAGQPMAEACPPRCSCRGMPARVPVEVG